MYKKNNMVKTLFYPIILIIVLSSCYRYSSYSYESENNYNENTAFELIDFSAKYPSLKDIRIAAKKIEYLGYNKDLVYPQDSLMCNQFSITADVYVQTMCGGMGFQQTWDTLEAQYRLSVADDSAFIFARKYIDEAKLDLSKDHWNWQLCATFGYFTYIIGNTPVTIAETSGEKAGCTEWISVNEKIYKITLLKEAALGSLSTFSNRNLGIVIADSTYTLRFNSRETIAQSGILDSLKNALK